MNRTLAPASRRTRARVLSGATALVRNRPECGQAALCQPLAVHPITAFAPAFCHSQRQPQPFKNQSVMQSFSDQNPHGARLKCGIQQELDRKRMTRLRELPGHLTPTHECGKGQDLLRNKECVFWDFVSVPDEKIGRA